MNTDRMMTPDGFQHRLVTVSDVRLHTVVGGTGPPLLLLHGFPQTWYAWRKVMPLLATRHRVVAMDLRGAGHSDCPQGGYDKATMASDAHEVMRAQGHQRYAVCGHDIGAMVAHAQASIFRDAVTRLVILDAPLAGWSRWEQLFADPKLWHWSFHMKADLPERLIYGREYDYVSSFLFERAFNHGAFDAETVDIFAQSWAQPGRTRGAMEWYRTFEKDRADALRWKSERLAMPVLALGGDQRWGAEIIPMLQELATDVRGGSVAECGHWIAEERPAELAAALLEFLTAKSISAGDALFNDGGQNASA